MYKLSLTQILCQSIRLFGNISYFVIYHFVMLSNKMSHKTSWIILFYSDFLWSFILKITQHNNKFLKGWIVSNFFLTDTGKRKIKKDHSRASCIEIMLSVQCVLKTKPNTRISLRISSKTTWRYCKVAPQYRNLDLFILPIFNPGIVLTSVRLAMEKL